MTRTRPALSLLPLLALTLPLLPGCFIFVDEVDIEDDYYDEYDEPGEPVFVNSAPVILEMDSWWLCDFDSYEDAYFFEFQAAVDDYDGFSDVAAVDVTVQLADEPDFVLGVFGLNYEGDGIWGGLVWEDESDLFCGEAVDVVVEAWDFHDAYDRLMIRY